MDNQINIKYMFTVIGGGWTRVSRAYFIADDRVYFLNKFSPADLKMFEKHFDNITATLASVNFDTTGLDFVNHGTNVGFDMPTITMYRYEDGKFKKLWSEGDYRNSEAVDTIQRIFQDSRYLTKGEIPPIVIGEVSSDTEAAEIIANLDAHRPDYQMTLAKAGVGMSFSEKYKTMREEIGKILEIGGESR